LSGLPARALRLLALLAVCANASIVAAPAFAGCDDGLAAGPRAQPFTVPSRHVLYGFGRDGTLYRGDFNGGPWQPIRKHALAGVNATLSHDGNLVAYGGDLARPYATLIGDENATELWLFDLRTQQSHRVMQRPFASMITVNTVFSPDGRYAATFSNYDDRTPRDRRSGLFLIDTSNGRVRPLGFSRDGNGNRGEITYGSPSWSQDGRLMLLYRTTNGFRHAQVDLSTGSYRSMSGRYVKSRSTHEFLENGRSVPMQRERPIPSLLMQRASVAPGGKRVASIDGEHRLSLRAPGKRPTIIARGRYDMCEGVTIGITGWLDEDYLVYVNADQFFVHEARTGRTRPIDLGNLGTTNFFWSNTAAGASSP
jgi:hypothetical protein